MAITKRRKAHRRLSKRRRVMERFELEWENLYDPDYYGDSWYDYWDDDDYEWYTERDQEGDTWPDPEWSLDHPAWKRVLESLIYRRTAWERILDGDPFRLDPPPRRGLLLVFLSPG